MAIGTLAAVALGAGALGSAAISSGASGRAANAATQAADQSAQVQREVYQQNAQTLAPFVRTGSAAGNQINALLGLETQQPVQQPAPAMPAGFGGFNALGGFGGFNGGRADFGGRNFAGAFRPQQAQPAAPVQSATDRARAAFDQFRNSTGYQFRLGEGMNALQGGYAGAGTIQSGAAIRAGIDYGQNFASNEFANYMNALGNQQGVGLSAAGAQAGVGTNFANSISNINSERASNIGNAALANAGNLNSLIGTGMAGILKYGVK